MNLVIGADRGIAREICLQLHARGESVIAACLGDGAALPKHGVSIVPGVDVTSSESVHLLARRLKDDNLRIKVLYHVAGVLGLDELGSIDFSEMKRQFEINALGPLRTVEALLDRLGPGSKIGIVTSRVGSLADNGSGGMYAYRASKAAANMIGLNLHRDLGKLGILVQMLHPGMVATDLTKNFPGQHAYIEADEAARGLIARMDELTAENAGRFVHANGQILPW